MKCHSGIANFLTGCGVISPYTYLYYESFNETNRGTSAFCGGRDQLSGK